MARPKLETTPRGIDCPRCGSDEWRQRSDGVRWYCVPCNRAVAAMHRMKKEPVTT